MGKQKWDLNARVDAKMTKSSDREIKGQGHKMIPVFLLGRKSMPGLMIVLYCRL